MPDNLDLLSEKKCQKALAKSKDSLFGKKFLKVLAKENKDNKDLKEMLLSYDRHDSKKTGYNKRTFNRRSDQFFQQRPTNNLQFVGDRRGQQTREPLQAHQDFRGRFNRIGFQQNQTATQSNQNRQFSKKPANR